MSSHHTLASGFPLEIEFDYSLRQMPMEEKENCWEYMKCGREPGGINADVLGICPTSIALKYDGINGGKCAGRYCWFVAGTFCHDEIQGTFAAKIKNCIKCPFFMMVAQQEGKTLVFTKQGFKTLY